VKDAAASLKHSTDRKFWRGGWSGSSSGHRSRRLRRRCWWRHSRRGSTTRTSSCCWNNKVKLHKSSTSFSVTAVPSSNYVPLLVYLRAPKSQPNDIQW